MGKWIKGIAGTVIAGVLVWWLTIGLKPDSPQRSPSPPPPVAYSVDGFWNYKMTSKESGQTHHGSLRLTMSGSQVTGIFEGAFDKTNSGVSGNFANNTLELNRETGMDDTLQIYRLTKQSDNKLTGTFWNRGKWKDEGTIEITR